MKCGKPYCACVGQCFAESSPLNDNGAIMTDDATYRKMKQERELALADNERNLQTLEANRVTIDRLTAKCERLKYALTKANSNHEEFERKWYLSQDECERLRADAERYRWLRDNNYDRTVCQIHTIKHWYEPHSKTGEPTEWRVRLRGPRNLDAAIDAARAKP